MNEVMLVIGILMKRGKDIRDAYAPKATQGHREKPLYQATGRGLGSGEHTGLGRQLPDL